MLKFFLDYSNTKSGKMINLKHIYHRCEQTKKSAAF